MALGLALAGTARAQTKLNGAGATFPAIIYQDWMVSYNKTHPDVQLNYQPIGSGGGVRQYSEGTVDFGASDFPMTDSAIAAVHGDVIHIPAILGGVLPTYNVPDITAPLKFTGEVLAGIFLGTITKWNDPRLASLNPGVKLPDLDIAVNHRSDGSGTTFIWTDYLSKVSPEWLQKVGRGPSVNWPVGIGASGNAGVSAGVKQTPGAIGYVELGYAQQNHLATGLVKNKAGSFVSATAQTVSAAAAGAMSTMGPTTDFRVSITNADGANSYPISSFTWILLHKSYTDAARGKALLTYIWWTETVGQTRAEPLGYAPVPQQLRPWIQARLKSITAGGQVVLK
jgi:phosphate transport system substrate-binding protein